MDEIYDEIFSYVEDLTIIDTHEHLNPRQEWQNNQADFFHEYLTHYFNRDLISAGITPEVFGQVLDVSKSVLERWELLEPYWEKARYTGYGRALDKSVKGLYGIDGIRTETIEDVVNAFNASLETNRYERVLKDKSRIETALVNHMQSMEADERYFTKVYPADLLILPKGGGNIALLEKDSGMKIRSMDDFFEAGEKAMDRAIESGAKAFKCGIAYDRSLKFDRYTRHEAEEEFNRIYTDAYHAIDKTMQSYPVGKAFQDYSMHHFMKLADRRGLVVQFHTGLQEGNGNILQNSNPEHLMNLFLDYPGVKFDIFHIGYPYQQVLSAVGKSFPNVYINMCWAHIISPQACVDALVEWLDVMPYNKILAFGGDYIFIDGVYGHQLMARENVSKALAIKVKQGVFDTDRAKVIARDLFYNNPKNLYQI